MTTYKTESSVHVGLVQELMAWLRDSKGYRITGADLEGYPQPKEVENENGLGDGENKRPDIDAFDDREQVFVRGEAKTGDGDLTTRHTKTQFRLFANRHNTKNGKTSLLYVIVPSNKMAQLESVLADLGLLSNKKVIRVRSDWYK